MWLSASGKNAPLRPSRILWTTFKNSYFSKIGRTLSDDMTKQGFPEWTVFDEPVDSVYPPIKVDKMMVDILFSEINVKGDGMWDWRRVDHVVPNCATSSLSNRFAHL